MSARRADLCIQTGARCCERRLEPCGCRSIHPVGLRLRRRDQGHHLAVEELLQGFVRQGAKTQIEHEHHDAKEQEQGNRDGEQQPAAEGMHGLRGLIA